jgi:outer membrane protein OmpA-like peptidoglycan-associated protein
MKIRLFLGAMAISTLSFAQDAEKIRLQVRVVNRIDGSEIKNAGIKLKYAQTDQNIPLKTEKKKSFYEVNKGSDIQVIAEAFQYYGEAQRMGTDLLFDEDVLEIKLNPKPSGAASLAVVDALTRQPIAASVQIRFENQSSTQATTPTRPELEIYFEKNGNYTFIAEAPGYKKKEISTALKTDDSHQVLIALDPLPSTYHLVVTNKVSGEPIQNLKRLEVLGKNLVYDVNTRVLSGEKDQKVDITVEVEGFKPLQTTVTLAQKEIQLGLEPLQQAAFSIQIVDVKTKEVLQGRVSIKTPKGQTLSVEAPATYTPTEEGEYEFIYTTDGFGSYSHKEKTRFAKDENDKLQIELAVTQPIVAKILVKDQESLSTLNQADISLKNEKGEVISGTNGTFTLATEQVVQYDISAPGYERKTGKLTLEKSGEHTLTVSKVAVINFTEQEYSLVDAYTGKAILKSQLFILDADKKPVETLFNAAKGTYMTYKIDPSRKYTAEVKTDGYLPFNQALTSNERQITLRLIPAGLQEVSLQVQDSYTGENLSPKKISAKNAANADVQIHQDGDMWKITLLPEQKHTFTVEVAGYETQNISLETWKNEALLIRKSAYPLRLKISPELSTEDIKNTQVKVSLANGRTLKGEWENSDYLLLSNPDDILQIEIKAPGYHPYMASNNRQQKALFELPVALESLPKAPEKMEAKVGKSYILTGVNFEQSQTTMLAGSEEKLKEVLQFMKENPAVRIEIVGHTERTGDERQNVRLSEFRARTVANWLFNNGISSDRMNTAGKGSAEPIDLSNPALNRRIEVKVIEE